MDRNRGRKEKIRRLHQIEAIVLGAVGIGIAAMVLFQYKNRTKELVTTPEPETEAQIQEEVLFFSQDTVEFEGETYQRNTYIKPILCMGVDRKGTMEEKKTPGSGGQADGLFLLARDTARNSLKILMIPRDTMTKITLTDLSGNVLGKDVQHLTLAYAYGDGRETSCAYMAEAVSDLLLGFPVESYLAADTDVISLANDMVGGVTVTVPTEGMEAADAAFVLGSTVHLMGQQAERFVRYRDIEKEHSALYRMDQQKEYLEQFYRTMQKKAAVDEGLIPRMLEAVEPYMVTNMEKADYLKLAMDMAGAGELTGEMIKTLPGQGISTAKYDEFYPDENGLKKVILELFYRKKQE